MTRDESIRIKLNAVKFIMDDIAAMLDEPVSIVSQSPTEELEKPQPETVTEAWVSNLSSNPYANTPDKVKIQTDINLYLEETATAPFLQSRFIRQLWDIAEAMDVQLEIVNACLLSGVPANNTAHYDDCRTVDIRYLRTDAENKDLINRILAAFPVYDPATQYVKWATDDSEVRVSPEIRDRLKLPWKQRIQADPAGNHDNHIHVRFGE